MRFVTPYRYIFDVPVYRLPEDLYYRQRNAFVAKWKKEAFPDSALRQIHDGNRDHAIATRDHLIGLYGGCWRYNEVVGHIRLHFFGSQLRGEYFGVKAQRIVRSRRKLFEWKTDKLAPDVDVPNDATNAEIASLLRQYLQDCNKELPRRHIDAKILDRVAPHVDWRALLGWH
jgi:hypothetical protein